MYSESEDICFEPHFDRNDRDLELRLNAVNALVSSVCFRKENKLRLSPPKKALIIKTRQQIASECEQFAVNDSSALIKPRSPSALKSPNSPSAFIKKSVRFADSMGRDLESIRVFENDAEDTDEDEPLSVSRRMRSFERNSSSSASSSVRDEQHLSKLFQTRSKKDIYGIVEAQNVCIESISSHGMCISGFVQVKNVAFEKEVRLRYTLDNWESYAESPCTFSFSNVTENQDFFCFSLCVPPDLPVGSCCEVCVRFVANGQNYWDNNNGENYKFDCCAGPSAPDHILMRLT